MSVVCWRRDGDRPGAPHICVTQLIGELLQLVSIKVIVVPEDVVVTGTGGALDTLVRAEIEVKLSWVGDAYVHSCSSWNVATLATLLLLVSTEESGVVTLLHHDEGDAWLVVSLQLDAGLSDSSELVL